MKRGSEVSPTELVVGGGRGACAYAGPLSRCARGQRVWDVAYVLCDALSHLGGEEPKERLLQHDAHGGHRRLWRHVHPALRALETVLQARDQAAPAERVAAVESDRLVQQAKTHRALKLLHSRDIIRRARGIVGQHGIPGVVRQHFSWCGAFARSS